MFVSQAKPDKIDGNNYPVGRIPQEIKDNKYPRTYYPNTEKIGKDEMRITALGTGMPPPVMLLHLFWWSWVMVKLSCLI
jgi:hypothetical protein